MILRKDLAVFIWQSRRPTLKRENLKNWSLNLRGAILIIGGFLGLVFMVGFDNQCTQRYMEFTRGFLNAGILTESRLSELEAEYANCRDFTPGTIISLVLGTILFAAVIIEVFRRNFKSADNTIKPTTNNTDAIPKIDIEQ